MTFGLHGGTQRQFGNFVNKINEFGSSIGLTFKGEVQKSVNFLDITTTMENGTISTSLYVKPTDANRYLNKRSDHSPHTFRGMPYSQFRRAVILCSDKTDREKI